MPAAKKKAAQKPGLYANIHAKQERIAQGSGEHMRKAGAKGAPSSAAFEQAARTSTVKQATRTPVTTSAVKKTPPKKAAARKPKQRTPAAH